MIVTFLENLQKELLEDQFSLEKEIHHLRNQMNQNQTMLDRLKREQDERLESFSPRDVLPYQKDLLHHFEEEHEDLQQRLDQAYDRQSSLRIKLEELDSVLKVARLKKEQAQLPEVDSNRIAILETQENERQRISRELHDSTIQNLTSIVYKAELCSKLIDQDPIRCRLELLGIGQTLREIISDTREMIYNLRPMSFDDIGLDITIERALDKLESSESKKINFTVEGESYQLLPVIGMTLLRIIQEACSNAIRHAECNMINVRLHYYTDRVAVEIEDDGVGFDPEHLPKEEEKTEEHSGFGLSMMKERVYLLSGTIQIDSIPHQGTKVSVEVPISN